MSGPRRPVLRILFQTFIESFKPRPSGIEIGKDHFGNTYFEITSERRIGRRRASRWFEPVTKEDFQSEMPAEWEAWLRHRRVEPPTEEEISKNIAIMKLKKENADKLEAERIAAGGAQPVLSTKGFESFPKYEEYEIGGKPVNEK